MKQRVEGFNDLYKDTETGVIVNRSHSEREKYRQSKRNLEMSIDSQSQIADLKDEISEIKTLLHQILNNGT